MKIQIGIICPSEIAFRRFLPSLQKINEFVFAGVAIANPEEWFTDVNKTSMTAIQEQQKKEHEKAHAFVDKYGGRIFESYRDLVTSSEIDAIYLPLPPALHHQWAKLALEKGKHCLVEKPFTTQLYETEELISIAQKNNLAVHEDYMFIYHNQIKAINDIIANGDIGKVRHYRIQFGFPHRTIGDFRYNKALGGGALLDCGGYTIKYASFLLGPTTRIISASSYFEKKEEVDIFGAATLINEEGTIAQISFGMDCNYKCMLEAWGSKGTLTTCRVLTAPDGFQPDVIIRKGNEEKTYKLPSDEAFVKSIKMFQECIINRKLRDNNYKNILRQGQFIESFKNLAHYE